MPTSPTPQTTDFTLDVLGRYLCNGLDEALRSADPTALRPDGTPQADARPFDVIVVGGGSFGPIVAQHLFHADAAHRHRVLVLEAGRHVLAEHVQNLPVLGLGVPPPTTTDPGVPRGEVWGLPWRSNVPRGFPGLAYCLGGRSVYFGGWSPRPLPAELPAAWPAAVVADLNGGYFGEASEQLGTDVTNDFIFGPLHSALRKRLFDGIANGDVPDAIPLAQLPLHLSGVPAAQQGLFKLEAPLAVQGRPPRAGFFPLSKFSSVPLLVQAARAAQVEARGDDVKKRLMVVPDCHVTRLITAQSGQDWPVVAVETNLGTVPVPAGGAVVLALGTIESARLAKVSFPDLPNAALIGQNLIGHLRSNLTVRLPRAALPGNLPNELQASALFVKGRRSPGGGAPDQHFHHQITAAGLARPSADSEAELFKFVPDIDTLAPFRTATDDHVVLTIRGIGEMAPLNPASAVTLGANDEYGLPRAFVTLQTTANDDALWNTMDRAADDVALVFANGQPYEVLAHGAWLPAAAGQRAEAVAPFAQRRDGLGTTHHEAGTLRMGATANASVTDADARFHFSPNTYVAGPALFPTVGSPNPMLTGTALARRLGDRLAAHALPAPDPGFAYLFDGASTATWRMSTIRNQPGRDDPGRFLVVDGSLEAVPGTDLGLLWCTTPTPPDFELRLEWLRWLDTDNSGVFVRFPHPDGRGYDNTAFVGVDFGFEVQIDEQGDAPNHRTGAIYDQPGQALTQQPALPPGQWNRYAIRVQGQTYTVSLNGQQVASFVFAPGSDPAHPDRGLPSTNAAPRFVGLQTHTGRVAFRNIQLMAI